jgi:hypothetical protein
MNNEKSYMRFSEADVNWDELAGIGILKDEPTPSRELSSLLEWPRREGGRRASFASQLEEAGELQTLLSGEKTGVLSLSLVLLGADIELDATLQLTRKKGEVLIEIVGVEPADSEN